jgi:hypothetical protein
VVRAWARWPLHRQTTQVIKPLEALAYERQYAFR